MHVLTVSLDSPTGSAFTDGRVTINPASADGSLTVVEPGGLGIVTSRHGVLEFRYKTAAAPGTTLVKTSDGSLDQIDKNGHMIGYIDAAYAIDGTGTRLTASYGYDPATRQLVVTADTTKADGPVFIDPSWHCWLTASAYGLAWIVAVAAWVFTDGGAAWALRVWFGVSFNAANSIAKACALH